MGNWILIITIFIRGAGVSVETINNLPSKDVCERIALEYRAELGPNSSLPSLLCTHKMDI